MAEVKLMKGNEVIAEAAIRCGCDGYFGYPITPQSMGRDRHGGIAGRKRTGRDQYGIWRCILW